MSTLGDGTAPRLSAERLGNGFDLNAQNFVRLSTYIQTPSGDDNLVEHSGLTQNPRVHEEILTILGVLPPGAGSLRPSPEGSQNLMQQDEEESDLMRVIRGRPADVDAEVSRLLESQESEEDYHLSIDGAELVDMTDDRGNGTTPVGDMGFMLSVPNVTVHGGGDSHDLMIPTEGTYEIKFRATSDGIVIELLRGSSRLVDGLSQVTPTLAVRYLDLDLPAGTMAMLRITPQGMDDLRYDANGDGTFESVVTPTATATGVAAQDVTTPSITFSEQVQGTRRLVTVNTTDSGTGVSAVLYSFNGQQFQPYTRPLLVDPAANPTVYVYAQDNVANRTGMFEYKPLVLNTNLSRAAGTNEIVVTATVRNDSAAPVAANFLLTSARLNNRPTTTQLPISISAVAAGETVTRTLRFPANAAQSGARVTLSGSGTSHGQAFSGGMTITVP